MDVHIRGASICRRAPRISNLMFADNSIIFCRATSREVGVINEFLQTYANASSQCTNMKKNPRSISTVTLKKGKKQRLCHY